MPSLIYIRFTKGAHSLTVNKRNSRISESSRINESSTLVDIGYSVYYVDAKNTDNKVNNLVWSQNMSDVWNLHVQLKLLTVLNTLEGLLVIARRKM
jgi:hypothetical protein